MVIDPKKINTLILDNQLSVADAGKILNAFDRIDAVFGFLKCDPPVPDGEVQKLIKARDQARRDRNWPLADSIREQLKAQGIVLQDSKIE